MDRTVDHVLASIAAQQCGAFHVGQAYSRGVTYDEIRGRARRGSIHRRHPRTYVTGHFGTVAETEVWAALLAGGETSLLTGESAAFEYGLTRLVIPPRPTLLVEHRHRPLEGVRIIQSGTLHDDDRSIRRGRRIVRVGRMLVDLADDLTVPRLCRYLREADVRRMLDVDRLRSTMDHNRGRRGAGRMATALARYLDGDNGVDTGAEERLARMLLRAGVSDARCNVVLRLGGAIVRPDVWVDHAGLAIEVDDASHTLGQVMREDHLKEALLRSHDIPLIRVDQRHLERGVELVLDHLRDRDPRRTFSVHGPEIVRRSPGSAT